MIGRTIGNYVVREKIGEGGMGVVYRAEHPQIRRQVAIKVLHPGAAANPEIAHRFFNEARAATEIRNEHIVEVLDFGELPEKTPYIVMEWLQGESLGAALRAAGKLDVARAARIVAGVAHALRAAHAKGVVHRDLKPDNVFLVPREGDELVKVLDFGIAKLTAMGAPARFQTQTGVLIGTPAYMSPEQCRGDRTIDHRTDIYALGVMGYQMTTGRLPFAGEGLGELLLKHMTEEPAPPVTYEPDIPPALNELIARALAKEPDKRPVLSQILDALEPGEARRKSGQSQAAGPAEAKGTETGRARAAAEVLGASTTLGASASELRKPSEGKGQREGEKAAPGAGRGRAAIALAGGAAFVATAAIAFVVMRPSSDGPSPAPKTTDAPAAAVVPRTAPATTTPSPGATPRAAAAGGPRSVAIAIRTSPGDARLEIDGQPVANPFARDMPTDERRHTITARLPGYTAATDEIGFDRDRELLLTLGPVPAPAAPATGAAPARRAAAKPHHDLPAPAAAEAPTQPTRPTRPGRPGDGPVYRGTNLNIETEFPGPK